MIKSTVKNISDMKQQLNILVPKEAVDAVFDKNYKKLQTKVKVPGFRSGKIPIQMLRQKYVGYVYEDVLSEVINDSFTSALKEHDLVPISSPELHFESIKEGEEFEFKADIEIWPPVKVEFKNLDIKIEKADVTDKELEENLKKIQEQTSETAPLLEDRPTQTGDVLEIDFLGKLDGVPFEGGEAKNTRVELGSGGFLPDFEKGLTGMVIGAEKTFDVKFPDSYHAQNLAGKTASFESKLHKIFKKVLPEMNDEWAQKIDPESKTIKDFREKFKKHILQDKTHRLKDKITEDTLKALREKNKIENFPPKLLEKQLEMTIQSTISRLTKNGMNENEAEDYKNKYKADFEKVAREILQSQKLTGDLARQESLKVSDKEVDERFDSMKAYMKPEDLSQSKRIKDRIESELLQEKVLSFIHKENNIETQ